MNNPVKVGQSGKNCLDGENSSQLSEISTALTWDLSWVGWIHSHINDLLLQSEIHHSAKISLRWDVSPGWDDLFHINISQGFKENNSFSVLSRANKYILNVSNGNLKITEVIQIKTYPQSNHRRSSKKQVFWNILQNS